MKLKHLIKNDVFHFEDDNAEKELLVDDIVGGIFEFSSLYGTNKFCINKEWDYIGNREVVKLYNKSK